MTIAARQRLGLVALLMVVCAGIAGLVLVPRWRDRAARTERITQQYEEVARNGRDARRRYVRYALPADGVARCLDAIGAADSTQRVYVRLAPDYEVILYCAPDHHSKWGRIVWNVSPNVLRADAPAVETSDGLDVQEAAGLHHYYASRWIRDHPDARVETDLLWIDGPRHLADGGWLVESGMSQIAGDGLRSEIAADGSLVRIERVFSPA